MLYRPYIGNYCWGYTGCYNPCYYDFCTPSYQTVVVPQVVPQVVEVPAAAPNVIVDNSNTTIVGQDDAQAVEANLVGVWTAKPAEGVVITATLKQDGTFTWDMAAGDQKQSINGTYEMQGDTLVLNREDGQKLEGLVTLTGEKSFNFKAKGGAEDDPGLDFAS